ncbi:hypothetical protein [Alicyclobacillus fastidiosus]|uniref:DUF1320 domain-containing protein n=1 Tax=Alicyclobacillus fastidiosus TaxID=392011 RepID=A0ABV5AK68_9BACL|nr:hypothetical protein [Alicyclobacillus fastidiosus]WEH09270.1 hypothetical protein PYS47_21775 [Alicyclobacillus fastidiosus]
MTAYCTLSDVQALIKGFTIDENASVTPEEVTDDIIPEVSRQIDERLGMYYVTPITGTNALLTLNRISRWMAAAEVADRVFLGQAPSESSQSKTWRDLAEADLTRVEKGQILLTDAVATDDTPEAISRLISDKLSSPTSGRPKFSMGMKF